MIRNPILAAALSLVLPGLGQLYNRERAKGVAVMVIALGMAVSVVLAHSPAATVLIGLVYLAVLFPSVADAYQVASGRPSRFSGGTPWYVIAMLLTVGPFALPLLWQSPRFSRKAKWVWTSVVIVVALLCIVTMAAVGPLIDRLLQQSPIGL